MLSAASPFRGAHPWYMAAIDLLAGRGGDGGAAAAEAIREKLLEADTYRQKVMWVHFTYTDCSCI